LQAAEVRRASRRPTNDLTAYDLYLRAYELMLSPARNVPEVLRLLDEAIARDPDFGPALAWASICHVVYTDSSDDPELERDKGLRRGRRALQVAGDDPAILANAALALAALGEDISAMIALADRAVALNPGFARAWHASGAIRLYAGQLDLAIEHVENSVRLSPRARVGWAHYNIGTAHFLGRRFEEAVPILLLAIQEDPNFLMTYRSLAACYAHMGRLDDAREMVRRLHPLTNAVVPPRLTFRNPEHHELFLSGLRLAMGESQ